MDSKMGFWKKLKKPFFALAPMSDVTDVAFREMFARHGKPDVMFTEFVSVEGLDSPGKRNLLREFLFTAKQRPIVAQIWGVTPTKFEKAVKLVRTLGFDGVDINMGCPRPKEIKNGACAALINNPALAKRIIAATKKGAGKLPVSVKTRIGFKTIQTEKWIKFLLKNNLAALTVHGRTASEMSKVPTHWNEIARAVEIRNRIGCSTLIIGNGDIENLNQARVRIMETGVDGIMVGRAAIGNPWLFSGEDINKIDTDTRLKAILEHAALFQKFFKHEKNYATLKKFFKAYTAKLPDIHGLRVNLMNTGNIRELKSLIK